MWHVRLMDVEGVELGRFLSDPNYAKQMRYMLLRAPLVPLVTWPAGPWRPAFGPCRRPSPFGGSGLGGGLGCLPPLVVVDLACRDALVGGMSWRPEE